MDVIWWMLIPLSISLKNANYSKEYKAQKLEDEVLGDVL